MKICSRCQTPKALDEFHRQHTSKDGRKAACKICLTAIQNERSARLRANPEYWEKEKARQRELRKHPGKKAAEREAQLKYRYSTHGRAVRLYLSAQKRAKKSGIPFTITAHDVEIELLKAEKKFGDVLPFDSTGKNRALTPSLDQIQAGGGYVPTNIRVIHLCWNAFRGDYFTDSEALDFAQRMMNVLNS